MCSCSQCHGRKLRHAAIDQRPGHGPVPWRQRGGGPHFCQTARHATHEYSAVSVLTEIVIWRGRVWTCDARRRLTADSLGARDGTREGIIQPVTEEVTLESRKRERAFQDREHGAEPQRHGTAWPHEGARTHGEESAGRVRGGGPAASPAPRGCDSAVPSLGCTSRLPQGFGWMLCTCVLS